MSCLSEIEILDLAEEGRGHPHLDACGACRATLASLAAPLRLLGEAADGPAEEIDIQKARGLLRPAAPRRGWPLAAAAVLLAAVGAASWLFVSSRPPSIRSAENVRVDGSAIAAAAAPGDVILDDGTRIRLDPLARVRLQAGGITLESGGIELDLPRPLRVRHPLGSATAGPGRCRLRALPGEVLGPDSPSVVAVCLEGGLALDGKAVTAGEAAARVANEPPVTAREELLAPLIERAQAAALVKRLPEALLAAHPELPRWLEGGEAEQLRAIEAMTGAVDVPRLRANRRPEESRVQGWAASVAPGVTAIARRPASARARLVALYGLRWLMIPREHHESLAAVARTHLDDPDASVRAEAVELLARAGGSAALALDRIDDPSPEVRRNAVKALREAKHPRLADLAEARAFGDPDVGVRQAWFLALLDAGPDRAKAATLRGLNEDALRMDACQAIARWKLLEAVPNLRDLVTKGDPGATYAVKALGELGATEALPEILALEGRPGFERLSEWFIDAYGRLRDPRALPSVRRHLASSDPRMVEHALWAADAIDPEGAVADLRRIYPGAVDSLRRACLYLLAERGEPGLLPALLKEAEARHSSDSPLGHVLNDEAFLFLANRYRNPAAYAKLRAAVLPNRLVANTAAALDRLAAAAGLTARAEAGVDVFSRAVTLPARVNAARALADLCGQDLTIGILLEGTEIVVWSRAEARAKLRAWSLQQK